MENCDPLIKGHVPGVLDSTDGPIVGTDQERVAECRATYVNGTDRESEISTGVGRRNRNFDRTNLEPNLTRVREPLGPLHSDLPLMTPSNFRSRTQSLKGVFLGSYN